MIYSVVYSCQLFVFVIRIRYCCLFVSYLLLFVSYFYSLFDYSFVSFHLSFVLIVVQKREKKNSDPELCSGVSILQYIKYLRLFQHHHPESINIIQQTPQTLS